MSRLQRRDFLFYFRSFAEKDCAVQGCDATGDEKN
jgi:hypothetical protein